MQGDFKGTKEAAFSIGATYLVTRGLKHIVHEERPDESNEKSFPSGHTSQSFAAAATMHKRYGWEIGVPAHTHAKMNEIVRKVERGELKASPDNIAGL